jgi:hypothetical protein
MPTGSDEVALSDDQLDLEPQVRKGATKVPRYLLLPPRGRAPDP